MQKLKPCPFCGGEGEIQHSIYRTAPDFGYERMPQFDSWYVKCKECLFARLPYWGNTEYDTKEQAVDAWNTRV